MTLLVSLLGGWASLVDLVCLRDSASDLAWGLGVVDS
jgi:hypothetical protein